MLMSKCFPLLFVVNAEKGPVLVVPEKSSNSSTD